MHHRTAYGLAGGDIPEPRGFIVASGEDRLAIRAEGNRGHCVAVGEDLLEMKVAGARQAARLARATRRPASSPASAAIRIDSTVQSIPTPICPFSKAI